MCLWFQLIYKVGPLYSVIDKLIEYSTNWGPDQEKDTHIKIQNYLV